MTNSLWDFIVSYCCFSFRLCILKISLLCPPDQTGDTVFCSFVHVPVSFKIPFFFLLSLVNYLLFWFPSKYWHWTTWVDFCVLLVFVVNRSAIPRCRFQGLDKRVFVLVFDVRVAYGIEPVIFRSCAIIFPRSKNRKVIRHPKKDYTNTV